MDRDLIERIAEAVIKAFEIKIPVQNIHDIVTEKLHGQIIEDQSLSFIVDGRIWKENNSFVISVPPAQSINRSKFTIAHELGHLFLHMGYRMQSDTWEKTEEGTCFDRHGDSQLEKDANHFAACFLMPRDLFSEQLNSQVANGTINIENIANYFGVSLDAVINRGKWLGYFKW